MEATSLDGEQFVPSNGCHTPQLYLHSDRMKAFSRLSRFGMTFKPLTEDHGAALLTWYLEDSRAKILARQEEARASMVNVLECGSKWHGSLAKYDHDSCLWRTRQHSLLGGLELFSETWPRWGTMRNGECSTRSIPVHFTSGSVFGYWPTPTKMMTPCSSEKGSAGIHLLGALLLKENGHWPRSNTKDGVGLLLKNREWRSGRKANPNWTEWLMGYPVKWTELTVLGMDKFRRWLDLHGIPSTKG